MNPAGVRAVKDNKVIFRLSAAKMSVKTCKTTHMPSLKLKQDIFILT